MPSPSQYSQHLVPLPFETPDGETASVVNQIVVKPANSTLPNRRWYRTDDIGYYDEDGLLYVYGKWFNTLGPITGIRARIQENEIESILLSHPAVEEVSSLFAAQKCAIIERTCCLLQTHTFVRLH